jgi:hypothetical protein
MTRENYLKALDELDLGHASQETARVLGVKPRTIRQYAQGKRPVPEPIELLLAMYCKHGIPKRWLKAEPQPH